MLYAGAIKENSPPPKLTAELSVKSPADRIKVRKEAIIMRSIDINRGTQPYQRYSQKKSPTFQNLIRSDYTTGAYNFR